MLRLIIEDPTIEKMSTLLQLSAQFAPESIPIPAHHKHIITGAGGSIGSALAHTIPPQNPAQILLLEKAALEQVFEHHRPEIVFHAAAFKDVLLMELRPFAIDNNAIGTFTLTQTAIRRRAEQLILVPALADPIRVEEIAPTLIAESASSSKIVYTGIRPGEKLHEQLLSAGEAFLDEAVSPLRAIHSPAISATEPVSIIEELQTGVASRDRNHLLRTQLIPAYTPSETLLATHATAERCA